MGLLLVLSVFFAVIMLFSSEFLALAKKMRETPWFCLLFPLCLMSWLFTEYRVIIQLCLLIAQDTLHRLIIQTITLLPFQLGASSMVTVLYLMLLSSLPVYIVYWLVNRNKYHKSLYWVTRLSPMIWIFWVMVIMG